MQTCPDTQELNGIPPAQAGPPLVAHPGIMFDLGERTGLDAPKSATRRDAGTIFTDLQGSYQADLERLNRRYANKLGSVVTRIKPVSERRKEALGLLDQLRLIVRRTNPVLDEAAIDGLIQAAVIDAYGDLADSNMAADGVERA